MQGSLRKRPGPSDGPPVSTTARFCFSQIQFFLKKSTIYGSLQQRSQKRRALRALAGSFARFNMISRRDGMAKGQAPFSEVPSTVFHGFGMENATPQRKKPCGIKTACCTNYTKFRTFNDVYNILQPQCQKIMTYTWL